MTEINHPQHYNQGHIECIDAIAAAGFLEGFCAGNVIKYVWRYRDKGGLDDLFKAEWYLAKLIDTEQEKIKSQGDLQA